MQDASTSTPDSGSPVDAEVIAIDPLPRITPGYKTTEFWIAIAFLVLDAAAAFGQFIPAEHAAVLATIVTFGYKILRTALKMAHSKDSLAAYVAELESTAALPEQFAITPSGSQALREYREANQSPQSAGVRPTGAGDAPAVDAAQPATVAAQQPSGIGAALALFICTLGAAMVLGGIAWLSGPPPRTNAPEFRAEPVLRFDLMPDPLPRVPVETLVAAR